MATTINPLAGAEILAILNKKQAAHYVQSHAALLNGNIESGRLKACKLSGKLVRIRLNDLEAFLESGATTNGGD